MLLVRKAREMPDPLPSVPHQLEWWEHTAAAKRFFHVFKEGIPFFSGLSNVKDKMPFGTLLLKVQGPEASASPGNLIEVHILRPHPRASKSESLKMSPTKPDIF